MAGGNFGPQPGYAPPPPRYTAAPQHPRPAAGFFDSIRRTGLVRTDDRWVGGVAGGLARRLGVDPTLVRCVWAVVCLFTGVGTLAYGLAWAMFPEERDGRIHAQQALDGDVSAGLAGAIAMALLGLGTIDSGIGLGTVWAGTAAGAVVIGGLWPVLVLTLIVVLAILLVRALKDHDARRRQSAPPTGSPAPGWSAGPWPAAAGQAAMPSTAGRAPQSAYPAAQADYPDPTTYPAAQAAYWPPAASTSPTTHPGAPASTSPSPAWAGVGGPEPDSIDTQVSHAGSHAAASAVSGSPTWTGNHPTYPPTQPASPQVQPRPRTRRAPGPGRRMSLTILALGLLAEAATLATWASGHLPVTAATVIGIGAPTALLGAGVLISGLRGRRATWMTGVGWLAAIVCVPTLAAASFWPSGSMTSPLAGGDGLELSDRYPRTITVTDDMLANAGSTPINLGTFSAGAVIIDMTSVRKPHPGVHLDTTVGAGTISLKTHTDLPVRLDATYRGAHLYGRTSTRWKVTPEGQVNTYEVTTDGMADSQFDLSGEPLRTWTLDDLGFGLVEGQVRAESGAAADSPDQAIVVTARVGIGGVRISEYPEGTTWSGQIYQDRWIVSGWTDATGYHSHLARDWPVPGLKHPAVRSTDANQCLVAATQWARDELDRLSQQTDSDSESSEDDALDRWEPTHVDDLYPDLSRLEDLSSRSSSAFTACLDHVLAGQPVDSFVPPNTVSESGQADSGRTAGSNSGDSAGADAETSPGSAASPSASPASAEAVETSVATISAAGRGTEGH